MATNRRCPLPRPPATAVAAAAAADACAHCIHICTCCAAGIPFLTKKVIGKPELQEHVPDSKTKTVYPKAAEVVKQINKWASKMYGEGRLSEEFVQEWKELFDYAVSALAC